MMNENIKIAILGAGVGGLTTAIALNQKGFQNITIYERRKIATTIGAGIVLWANATKILERLNLLEKIEKVGGKINKMQRLTDNNDFLGAINVNKINEIIGFPSLSISRKDLQGVLLQKIKSLNIEILYNHKATKIENKSVFFDKNKTVFADIIIGADGRMNSVARKYVNGNSKPVYQDFVNWVGVVKSDEPIFIENNVLDFWGCGERFGIVPISKYKGYWAGAKSLSLNSPCRNENNKDVLIKLFGQWSPKIKTIIQSTKDENIKFIEVFDHNPISIWHKENVCLIGDAGHAALPTSGQGACQAIEDAFHLSNSLFIENKMEEAFVKFQKLRFEKTTIITRAGRDFAKSLFNSNKKFCEQRNKKAQNTNYQNSSIGIAELWSKDLPN